MLLLLEAPRFVQLHDGQYVAKLVFQVPLVLVTSTSSGALWRQSIRYMGVLG